MTTTHAVRTEHDHDHNAGRDHATVAHDDGTG